MGRGVLTVAGWVAKLGFAALAVVVPLLGVWVGSSLAAWGNGPIWLVLLVGLAAFPLVPLAWDLGARRRRAKTKPDAPPILTGFDRLVLRTLTLNLVLVGGLVAARPGLVFESLSARGDWMLDDVDAAWADRARALLHRGADQLERLHTALHPNPYDTLLAEDTAEQAEVEAVADDALQRVREALSAVDTGDAAARTPYRADAWPFEPSLHPAVVALSPADETSIEAVAQALAKAEPDRARRIKALHDYVADRVAYDVAAYRAGTYGPQDAESVFTTRTSVCAGYANLLAALGEAAGEEIVVVGGDARGLDGGLSGEGHAWNAAKLDDRWVLLDATWNAGYVDATQFYKRYGTRYLMSPPEAFGTTHFPDDPKWQLRAEPISRGDFLRQPNLNGEFFAYGLTLQSPRRSQTTVGDALDVAIDNPGGYPLQVFVQPRADDGPMTQQCAQAGARYRCDFDRAGDWRVVIFGPTGDMGSLQVNARG